MNASTPASSLPNCPICLVTAMGFPEHSSSGAMTALAVGTRFARAPNDIFHTILCKDHYAAIRRHVAVYGQECLVCAEVGVLSAYAAGLERPGEPVLICPSHALLTAAMMDTFEEIIRNAQTPPEAR